MGFNGNSSFSNGQSMALGMDDRLVRTLPWQFRRLVPGWREVR